MSALEKRFKPKLREVRWSPKREEGLLEKWERDKVHKFRLEEGKPVFSIDTPPPYASGKWHVGAAIHYAQIDMVARYFRSKGYSVLFPMGIDRNGLPVEIAVEKKHDVRARELERTQFIEMCRSFLDEVESDLLRLTRSLGISADYEDPYRTDSPEYRALTQSTFITLWRRGLIYEDYRPTNWCPVCHTSISDAEIEYITRPSKLYYVKFDVKDFESISIATTRPELIGACAAVFLHPRDIRYSNLRGKKAVVPLYGYEVPVIENEAVDMDYGTGLMMICSYGDYTDVRIFRELGLKPRVLIDPDGKMNELSGKYRGLTMDEARNAVVEDLRDQGRLLKEDPTFQNVPICWRSGNPVEFVHMKEYYLKQTDFKDDIISISSKIRFCPSESITYLMNWVNSITTDWPISRRRIYGTELPIWYCSECGTPHVPEPGRYFVPWREPPPFKECSRCGHTTFVGEIRTFDTWMDSSVSALYISGWDKDSEVFEEAFPVSMRPQGVDIVRTWLYYSLLRVYQLTKEPAFRYIRLSGMGLDERGEAMSKSKGNVVDPDEVIEEFGADALRFWGASEAKLGTNYRYSKMRVLGARKFITKLWNVARFISTFPNVDAPNSLTASDELILSDVNRIIAIVDEECSKLDFFDPANKIRNFVWNLFAPHFLELVKPRAYNYGGEFRDEEQESAWYSLHCVLKTLLLLLHPIMPFITDYIWRSMYDEEGITSQSFPEQFPIEEEIYDGVSDVLVDFNSSLWRYKKVSHISLKDEIKGVVAPHALKPFENDIRSMHNIGRLLFERPEDVDLKEISEGIYIFD
ncbi:MAG: valine--tRNA ligase [Nitrososphaeria archaeon]|nr:valine--tRNA ligase [Nitrososphaeria archaeon]NIN52204.1 valine--tRNA ligase [Nitrososphaeria archaeon]NIQ32657.1 valine--tRNA ligase [Nitrososphaeria archaeon]